MKFSERAAAAALVSSLLLAACAQQPPAQIPAGPGEPQTQAQLRAKIHTELGAAYYSRGQLGVALQELNEALRSDTGYGPAYNVLGLVYAELGEYNLAEQNFSRALQINPNDSNAHNNYGWYLCQHGRENDAIQHFLQALKNPLYSTPEKSYVNAGFCARKAGDARRAEEYYERALRIQPSQPQALLGMAQMHYTDGRLPSAKGYLTRFMQLGQPDAESLWLGVRIERGLGDRDAEASYSSQLRNRFPQSKEAQALQSGKFE